MELLGQSRREGDLGGWWGGQEASCRQGGEDPPERRHRFSSALTKKWDVSKP